jgi:hypothetical protein
MEFKTQRAAKFTPVGVQRRPFIPARANFESLAKISRANAWANDPVVAAKIVDKLVDKCARGVSDRELAFIFTSFSELVRYDVVNHPLMPRAVCLRLAVLGSWSAFVKLGGKEVNHLPYSDVVTLSDSRDKVIREKVNSYRKVQINEMMTLLREARKKGKTGHADLLFLNNELLKYPDRDRYALVCELRFHVEKLRIEDLYAGIINTHKNMLDPFYHPTID